MCFSCINMVVGLGHRKYSWVFAFNKDLILDQQFILSALWSACSRYIEFRSFRISELSCTHYNGQALDSPKFFPPMFQNHNFAKIFYHQSFVLYNSLSLLNSKAFNNNNYYNRYFCQVNTLNDLFTII